MPFLDDKEQRKTRFQMGYEAGIEGDKIIMKETDWVKPEMHEHYLAGYYEGRRKLIMAINRLNAYGELREIIKELK